MDIGSEAQRCWQTARNTEITECKLQCFFSPLHSADEDAVSWLTSYGSWNAYKKTASLQTNKAQDKTASCRKSPFMQMSQAFRPMSCRFEKLRRFLLSQPRLLHSLRALQKFRSPTCISITLYNLAFKSLISCVKLLCSIAFAYGGKHVLGFSFGFYSMKLGRHSICHSGNWQKFRLTSTVK